MVIGTAEGARTHALEAARWGLAQPQKQLPSQYFYDTRGSQLFEEITRLPEYYLTRAERRLLEDQVSGWVGEVAPASLAELGAGSAEKTRVLLSAMVEAGRGRAYAPVDVAGEFLQATSAALRADYPSLDICPQVKDITTPLGFADGLPRPVLFALLGSTLGNFSPGAADVALLENVRGSMREGDLFLLGADLRPGPKKSVELLHAAYNDSRGVTAEFNLNMLAHFNRAAGTDFDLSQFRHRAFYARELGRIEMHLVSVGPQEVTIPGEEPISIARGESIRTEISCKYDRSTVDDLFARTGLGVQRWWEHEKGLYAMVAGAPL